MHKPSVGTGVLQGDPFDTTYRIQTDTVTGGVLTSHNDTVTLAAPCTSLLCLTQSSAIVTLPYSDIRGISLRQISPTCDPLTDTCP